MKRILIGLVLLVGLIAPASAQTDVRLNCFNPYATSPINQWTPCASVTVVTGNSTGTTGAVVGTLAGASGHTTFICGFNVSAVGGTAAVGPITIAGIAGSSMVYQLASAASGSSVGNTFSPCVPASAANTAITITTSADGSASAVDVNSWGYVQ